MAEKWGSRKKQFSVVDCSHLVSGKIIIFRKINASGLSLAFISVQMLVLWHSFITVSSKMIIKMKEI